MVTLLLTFFVMLLSLANVQDPELFNAGRDSFNRSVNCLGLGLLYGRIPRPNFGHVKIRYFISTPEEPLRTRTIDANQEQLRRIFNKLSRSVKTMPSQITGQRNDFSVTNIRFSPGDATLDEGAKDFLRQFLDDLLQGPDSRPGILYVLALAAGEAAAREQWILSAKRAQAVSEFLRQVMASSSQFKEPAGAAASRQDWSIYSWGAGPGGDWVTQDSLVSGQSQVLIAVLRGENRY